MVHDILSYAKIVCILVHFPGWIITKHEKGKIKVAECKEDESNVYEKSRGKYFFELFIMNDQRIIF